MKTHPHINCTCKKCNEEREYRKNNKKSGIKKPKKYGEISKEINDLNYSAKFTLLPNKEKFTMRYVARLVGMSDKTIKKLIKEGKINPKLEKDKYYFNEEDVSLLLNFQNK